MKKIDGLLKGEIRKIEKFAQKRDGGNPWLAGYYYNETPDEFGFVTVKCEICSNDIGDRARDVTLFIYVPDRRKSFVCKALSR